MIEFKVNDYLSLRFEDEKTIIYVAGKRFRQCINLLLDIPVDDIREFDQIQSIDEAAERLSKSMEDEELRRIIPAKVEFWGHCSNLQVWFENNYNTRIIHSNIAFPLLKKLSESGDIVALRVFKEEIAKRFSQGNEKVRTFLIDECYMDFLSREEVLSLNIGQIEIIHELEDLLGIRIKFKTGFHLFEQGFVPHKGIIKGLVLDTCDLEELPEPVRKLKSLVMLKLHGNRLKTLPEWIGELQNLKSLQVQNNRLISLPNSIGKLSRLEIIELYNNQLKEIPESIGNLRFLKRLELQENQLKTLPNSIGNLTSLEVLFINKNKIEKYPKSLENLTSLKDLVLDEK
ncbi:MAG: leucine-rich repeat domain-containing protein [Candidatus Lokiarchaeota archaeon]|nr:leucine-rich repeat domain-containing protein [Candidatus Lokiarchaeota archaeon]